MTTIDHLDERTARAVGAFFDLPLDETVTGAPLPLMWQAFYFLPRPAQSEIGPDGHPTVGEPTPPGMRRMFAGGRVTLQPGVKIGDTVTASHSVTDDKEREGKAGKLRFVTHRSAIGTDAAEPTLIVERDVVYIPLSGSAPSGSAPKEADPVVYDAADGPPEGALAADAYRAVDVDPTLLFRFSALTYNAHRIHYDREYTRDVEGYPGLVVHGPLQAVLMAQLAQEQWAGETAPSHFSYRLVAPLFEGEGLFVTATRNDEGAISTQVMSGSGRVTATGQLS